MNYEKIYYSLMNKAKTRVVLEGYFERHHIVPLSLGGKGLRNNIVKLTGREHFIAHRLLVKFCENADKQRMICALKRFIYSKNGNYCIKSKDYEIIKIAHQKAASILLKDKKVSPDVRLRMSKAQLKRYEAVPTHWRGRNHTKETKLKMSVSQSGANNPQFGKERTKEEKRKISSKLKGITRSDEFISKLKSRKMSTAAKEKISNGLRRYHAKRQMEL